MATVATQKAVKRPLNKHAPVYITVTAKEELDRYCEENPEVKKVFFISDALIEYINKQRLIRGLESKPNE